VNKYHIKSRPKRSKSAPKSSISIKIRRFLLPFLAFFFIVFLFVGAWLLQGLPSIDQVKPGSKRQSIVYLNRHRQEIGRHGDLTGETIQPNTIPASLKTTLLAIEDSRFMEHHGIDIYGLFRAFIKNITSRSIVQGGSTITQQIAKNIFLTPERSLKRKVQELILAWKLENKFSKNQLLAIYFNRVYLGSGVYGVDAAAQEYFGKPASRLTLAESALIVSLLKAPSRLSPFVNPDKLRQRGKLVITRMVQQNTITPALGKTLEKQIDTLKFQPRSLRDNTGYFIDYARQELASILKTDEDLIVTTTLNSTLQHNANTALQTQISENQASLNVSQGAFVGLQHDGAIVALVGGLDYYRSSYNRAWQSQRQYGSIFKLFVYLAGLEHGLKLTDMFSDTPPKLQNWQPRNYGWRARGQISLLDGFTYSVNAIAVRIAHHVGIQPVIEVAKRLGLSGPFEPNLSTALGSTSGSLLTITKAYTTLANDGYDLEPYCILEVHNLKGQLLYQRPSTTTSRLLLTPDIVQQMTTLLQSSNQIGTGRRAYIAGISKGSKTGTSQNYKDAWFMGFTPTLTLSVWVGNDDGAPMKRITGGRLPAQIWRQTILSGLPKIRKTGSFPGKNSRNLV
jgi:penicillin-binding protein 1A